MSKEMDLQRQINPGKTYPDPETAGLEFSYRKFDVSPVLWMYGYSGSSVAGSIYTEALWQDRVRAEWLCPGDVKDDPTRAATVDSAHPAESSPLGGTPTPQHSGRRWEFLHH